MVQRYNGKRIGLNCDSVTHTDIASGHNTVSCLAWTKVILERNKIIVFVPTAMIR